MSLSSSPEQAQDDDYEIDQAKMQEDLSLPQAAAADGRTDDSSPKNAKKRERAADDSDSDHGLQTPDSQKRIKETTSDDNHDNGQGNGEKGVQDTEGPKSELSYDLGGDRFAKIQAFRGTVYVAIREYYTDKKSGQLKPGKAGINLTIDQYRQLVSHVPTLNSVLETYKKMAKKLQLL
jgi:hypothetical protein